MMEQTFTSTPTVSSDPPTASEVFPSHWAADEAAAAGDVEAPVQAIIGEYLPTVAVPVAVFETASRVEGRLLALANILRGLKA